MKKRATRREILCPDGNYRPVKVALQEWEEFTAPMVKLGFHLHGFNPSVQFRCPDSGVVFDLPRSAVRRLNAALTRKTL